MGLCPSSCGDITLIGNPTADCITSIRQTTPSRIAFFPCNTTLPSPITDSAIKALFDDGTIVASSPLANITWGDPTYEEVPIDDCSVPQQILVSREVTFEDRVAVTDNSGSPASYNDYKDYDFWQDKKDNQTKLNYIIIYCNGDAKIGYDEDGVTLLTARITAVLNYQRPANAGGKSVEFKQVSILFQGDPINLANKPQFNTEEAGIVF